MGDTRLLQASQPVTAFATEELFSLITDLEHTMAAKNGAGLAAPQIGVPLQVVIFGFTSNPRYPDAEPVPYTVLCNPVLTPVSEEIEEAWEGCLSVSGMRGFVPRFKHLHYRGYDQHGRVFERTVSGFHARVVQHECDHLLGILYPMRMTDMSKFGFTEVLFPDELSSED